MPQPNSSNTNSQTPTPETFTLDYHTKQFFDPTQWEGAVEARFFLDSADLSGREFVGRIVLPDFDDPLIAMQEIGGGDSANVEGATLIKRTPHGIALEEAAPTLRPAQWAEWLSIATEPRRSGGKLPILPNLSSNYGLLRLHFDATSGFGVQVWSQGHAYLVDLRDVESAERGHHPHVDMPEFAGIKGWMALGPMNAANSHTGVEARLRDPISPLAQTLRFYHLSDDERAREVFGCNYKTLQLALEAMRCVMIVALGPGGEMADRRRVTWHPFHMRVDQSISTLGRKSWWHDGPPTTEMERLCRLIYDILGCHLRLEVGGEKGIVDARSIGQEWANEFYIGAGTPSAHEAVEARLRLKEILGD